jgi:hypothetical protein
MAKKWFKPAVEAGLTSNLGGWSKDMPQDERLERAYLSRRPKSLSEDKKLLSVQRALQALANVTRDRETRAAARSDIRKIQWFREHGKTQRVRGYVRR